LSSPPPHTPRCWWSKHPTTSLNVWYGRDQKCITPELFSNLTLTIASSNVDRIERRWWPWPLNRRFICPSEGDAHLDTDVLAVKVRVSPASLHIVGSLCKATVMMTNTQADTPKLRWYSPRHRCTGCQGDDEPALHTVGLWCKAMVIMTSTQVVHWPMRWCLVSITVGCGPTVRT
jgi:hypothetical protein